LHFRKRLIRPRHVAKRQRYTLAAAGEEIEEQWRDRKGKTTPPLIRTITRKGTPGSTYDPFHKRLQADLLPLLVGRYGNGNVVLESNNVDIIIKYEKKAILIEIKTDSNPRGAIREARSPIVGVCLLLQAADGNRKR